MIQIRTVTNTNLRPDHNTDNAATKTYPAGTVLTGTEWFVAPIDLYNTKGVPYQRVGDKWLRVSSPAVGWMAVRHMGSTLLLPEIILDESEPPVPSERKIVSAVIRYEDGTTEELVR